MVIAVPTQAPAPEPTAAQSTAVGVGARVEVTGTGAANLRVRQVPGIDAVSLRFVPDGTRFVVIAGPENASGYTWWKVDDQAGTVGWVAGQFLRLAP